MTTAMIASTGEDKNKIMEYIEKYLLYRREDLNNLIRNPNNNLSGAELVAIKYVRSMFEDYKFIADYLDRTQGKPIQKIITKSTTRDEARKLTDEELHERLRERGIDPHTGLPFGESFAQSQE